MKMSIITSSVVGLLFALGVTPAFASDGKIYAATDCVDTGIGVTSYVYGRAYNSSSNMFTYMECPVVKEIIVDTSLAAAYFYVTDRHYTANISCTLITMDGASNSSGYFTTRSSTGTSPIPQKLTYPSQTMYADSGYTVFRCFVPPRYSGYSSSLVSYRVDE